ncbi:ABC transporter substrate-binding protein [Geobacter sp. DSM 9736]|uniref:ABC transporter substrate-binding protein n=1 Tax=Geobacter sp. DSM 9736 TaxID=1277350 RepID=UPI000B511B4B|nr:ABC transporter substrate-binding protein [Geobacter sp. DSM 9736]SNB46221.1 NitT/TauT family transport system substrate-binding protein [Geobacter sp. DSM 9736]
MKHNAAVLVMVMAFVLSGCDRGPEKKDVSREAVIIGIGSQVLSTPILMAHEKGFFAAEGLDVTLKQFTFGKLALEALFAGQVNFATAAETPIVMNSFSRTDYAVVGTFVHNYDDSKILVRTDRGIKTVADLKGKRVGTTLGTSAHFYLDAYLNYYGMLISQVTLLDIPQKDLPDALARGEVDAVSVFEPYGYSTLAQLPEKSARLPKTELLRETFSLVAMKSYLLGHPETVKKILKAVERADAFILSNREQSIRTIAKRLDLDRKFLDTTWDDYRFDLSLDQTLLLTYEDVAQWAIHNRLTEKRQMPDYWNFLYIDGMKSVRPEAVRILR